MFRSENTWAKYLYTPIGPIGSPVLNQDTLAAWWIFILVPTGESVASVGLFGKDIFDRNVERR